MGMSKGTKKNAKPAKGSASDKKIADALPKAGGGQAPGGMQPIVRKGNLGK